MGRTLQRYIFLQVLAPFGAGLALFTFVLLIFSYILPAFLEVTVPMALLLACLMACGRLSADSEYTALRSSGISLYQFATPIAAFAGLICVVSIFLSVYTR